MAVVLSFFLTSILSEKLLAETWSCVFVNNFGAREGFSLTREGKVFKEKYVDHDYLIISENDKHIHLFSSYTPTFADYFSILLDKERMMFAKSIIELPPDKRKKDYFPIDGDCKIQD